MEDYRSYLTSAPDAPDADGIGERLRRLEDETRGSAPSSPSDESLGSGQANGSNASLAAGSNGVRASAAVGVGDKRDSIDSGDESLRTPLRRGQGWGFGPLFAEHKWFSSGSSFGDSQTWAECIGLQVRYSFGPVGALVVEVGYEHFNSTNIDLTVASGLTSQVAYELRLPLDPSYDDQIILAPGIGVEYLWSHPTDPQLATASSGVFVPRARLGYRHMILPAAGIDVSLDGGVATGSVPPLVSGPTASGGSSATAIVAINVAVVWGL
jgi:hypothetical protein